MPNLTQLRKDLEGLDAQLIQLEKLNKDQLILSVFTTIYIMLEEIIRELELLQG